MTQEQAKINEEWIETWIAENNPYSWILKYDLRNELDWYDVWCDGARQMAEHLKKNVDEQPQIKDFSKLPIEFNEDLSELRNGWKMFQYCTTLQSFRSNLNNLENGECMFFNCENLSSFTSDLSSLKNGYIMFADCYNLTTFTSELNNLTNGRYMFYGCKSLQSFTSDLSNLKYGWSMFQSCKSLTSFTSNLSNLEDGRYMFDGCKSLNEVTIIVDITKRTDWNTFFTKENLSIREEATLTIKDLDGNILI